MRYSNIFIIGSLFLSSLFLASPADATAPHVDGYVRNEEGTGIAGIWVRWEDSLTRVEAGRGVDAIDVRYAQTDANGYFFFESWADLYPRCLENYETSECADWIDTDLDGEDDAQKVVWTSYAFGCAESPHTFSVIKPHDWPGSFTPPVQVIRLPNVVRTVTLTDFVWQPNPITVAGCIRDDSNQPVINQPVQVTSFDKSGNLIDVFDITTDTVDGCYTFPALIPSGVRYSVRIPSIPDIYEQDADAVNDDFNHHSAGVIRFTKNVLSDRDTRVGDDSYEMQTLRPAGVKRDDCAGPDQFGNENRCNFVLRRIETFCEVPRPPSYLYPADGSVIPPGEFEVNWESVPGATGYRLRIDEDARSWHPGCNVYEGDVCSTITENNYKYTFKLGKTYNIWVHSDKIGCGYSEAINHTFRVGVPDSITPEPKLY